MLKHSTLVIVASSLTLVASACAQSPAYVEPPATEYAVAKSALTAAAVTDTVQVATVSREFMRVIGIRPVLGRLFIDADFQATQTPTAVVTWDLWTRRLGSDPAIIGRPIRLNGTDAVVVGVMPKNFEFPKGSAVWVPRR